MWSDFLARLVESFACTNPDAYFYYLCCKPKRLSEPEPNHVRSSRHARTIASRQQPASSGSSYIVFESRRTD
jgi:hypothetical protein